MPLRSGSKKRQIDVQKQKLKSSRLLHSKKKVTDFARRQAKPGRRLPVATNFTNTNFKTKQITLPSTKNYADSKPDSLPELFSMLEKNHSQIKDKALERILNYIISNKDSLPWFCSDILKKVSSLLMENLYMIRKKTMQVILTCSSLLTDLQFKAFLQIIELSIIPMMTHNVNAVNRDSLYLLKGLLDTQPSVTSSSTKILYKMLSMISTALPNKKELMLKDTMDDSITADEWRREVFRCIKSFLTVIMEEHKPIDEDEKLVTFDGGKPLYLPLYRNTGSQVEKMSYSWSNEDSYDNVKVLINFLQKLLPLLGEAIKGKLLASGKKRSNYVAINYKDEEDILLFVEILSIVGQWIKQSSSNQDELDEVSILVQQLCAFIMKGFPYELYPQTMCFQLNILVINLYSMFLFDTPKNSPAFEVSVIEHLENVFVSFSKVPESTIFTVIKFSKIFILSEKFDPGVKNALLFGLYGILESKRFSKTAEAIYSFFIDLTLDSDFNELSKTKAMSTWFKSLIVELNFMMKSGVVTDFNKKFLKYVRQVCAKRQPDFIEVLNQNPPSSIIDLLKYDNEDFQLTIISLIANINGISSDFLQDLAELIQKNLFSEKTANQLIYVLHSRFSRDARPIEKVEYVKLLLNLACDTLNEDRTSSSEFDMDVVENLFEMQRGFSPYLSPMRSLKGHQKLYKACFDCLPSYLKENYIVQQVAEFMKDLMYECSSGNSGVPVHTAIALLELHKLIGDCEDDLTGMVVDLMLSSLVYISVVTSEIKREDLERYSIVELEESLYLECLDVGMIFNVIDQNLFSDADLSNNDILHVFRIVTYIVRRCALRQNDQTTLYMLVQKMNALRVRSAAINASWVNICKLCHFI